MNRPIVVAVTGASGAVYAQRLLEVLLSAGRKVHLVVSPAAVEVFRQELGCRVDLREFRPDMLGPAVERGAENLVHHAIGDFLSPIASGSYLTGGMVICPCSGSTLGAITSGAGGNLVHRAAEVHLKERRPLILVPRETPVSLVHLDNLCSAARAGAIVLPASPGWYHGVRDVSDLVDFVVARILDQLGVEHGLMRRWGSADERAAARDADPSTSKRP